MDAKLTCPMCRPFFLSLPLTVLGTFLLGTSSEDNVIEQRDAMHRGAGGLTMAPLGGRGRGWGEVGGGYV